MQTNPFIKKKRCSRAKEAYGNSDFKKPPDNDMSPPILDIQYDMYPVFWTPVQN